MTDRSRPARLLVADDGDASCRDRLEQFVASVYRHGFGAALTHFHPTLLALSDETGELLGVIGAHELDLAPAFLEVYLDEPVEDRLAAALGRPVERADLVEVGNLATRRPGGGRWLVTTLAAWLTGRGRRWAVFTGTAPLRRMFDRLGAPLVDLGPADGERLGPERAAWGRYYDHAPRVCALEVERLRREMVRCEPLSTLLAPLWALAYGRALRAEAAA